MTIGYVRILEMSRRENMLRRETLLEVMVRGRVVVRRLFKRRISRITGEMEPCSSGRWIAHWYA